MYVWCTGCRQWWMDEWKRHVMSCGGGWKPCTMCPHRLFIISSCYYIQRPSGNSCRMLWKTVRTIVAGVLPCKMFRFCLLHITSSQTSHFAAAWTTCLAYMRNDERQSGGGCPMLIYVYESGMWNERVYCTKCERHAGVPVYGNGVPHMTRMNVLRQNVVGQTQNFLSMREHQTLDDWMTVFSVSRIHDWWNRCEHEKVQTATKPFRCLTFS